MGVVVALALYGWLGLGILLVAFVGIPLLGRLLKQLQEQDEQDDDDE